MILKPTQTAVRRIDAPLVSRTKPLGSDSECPDNLADLSWFQNQWGIAEGEAAAIIARFWAKVKWSSRCWRWCANTAGGNGMKHGQFTAGRTPDGRQRHIYAHRFSWMLAHGPIPEGLCVCHHCDNPLCVNPEHLFLGTQADNLADARRKGRLVESAPRTTRLSLADRLAIFFAAPRHGLTADLAHRYGVTKTCIWAIRRGRFVGCPGLERVPNRVLQVRGEVA